MLLAIFIHTAQGSGPPQKFGCKVFYGSDPTKISLKFNISKIEALTGRRGFAPDPTGHLTAYSAPQSP